MLANVARSRGVKSDVYVYRDASARSMLPRSPSREIRAALAQRLILERLLNRVSRIASRN